MLAFRWIQKYSFLILFFLFNAAAGGQHSSLTVRAGDEATLPCESLTQHNCDSTTWVFTGYSGSAVALFEGGQIHKEAGAKSVRLSVTADCALLIKKLTDQDVGQYSCRQVNQQGSDSQVHLSLIHIIKLMSNDEVTLFCNVQTHEWCSSTVEWLYEGKENISSEMEMSPGSCSATVTLSITLFNQSKIGEFLTCKVTDDRTKEVQLFPFSRQSSGGKTGGEATTTKLTTTLKPTSTIGSDGTTSDDCRYWLRCIIVSLGLAVLLISAVVVNMLPKTKGKKTDIEEKNGT